MVQIPSSLLCIKLLLSLKEDITLGKSFAEPSALLPCASSTDKTSFYIYIYIAMSEGKKNFSIGFALLCACVCVYVCDRAEGELAGSIYLSSSFSATCHFFSDAFSRD